MTSIDSDRRSNPLEADRREMDSIDNALLDLISRRLAVGRRIGTKKAQLGLPVVDSAREASHLKAIVEKGGKLEEPVSADVVHSVWRPLILATRAVQSPVDKAPKP